MLSDPAHLPTKERLLEAAGEVFAEKGFREATVRDICSRAGANLAAVNYHFRDKETLYAAVFEHARRYEQEHYPLEVFEGAGDAKERLAGYIRQFCLRLFDQGRPNWHVKLMSREMVDPTAELDTIVERAIRPKFELLCAIIGDFVGLPARHDVTELCAASVIGQCLHYHHAREVGKRLCAGWQDGPSFLDDIVRHVTWFSTRAIEGMKADLAGGKAPCEGTAKPARGKQP